MSFTNIGYVPAVLVSGAAIAFAASPAVAAEPGECRAADTVTVCEQTGSADVVSEPGVDGPAGGPGGQNGPYGPAGATPPVGN